MSNDSQAVLALDTRVTFPPFDLEIEQELPLGGVTGVFGPSGSGKSTLLRIIAGFERSAQGKVSFAGDCWQDSDNSTFVAAHRRPVGYVFQDVRLFTHFPVAGNLDFAAKRSPAGERRISMQDLLDTFDLDTLLDRQVDALSGGEKQRVAIARTLLSQPRLLLLDEPLAALDVGRKGEILPYLDGLAARFGIPIIYVSHAIDEVARLADRVIVLDQGRVVAIGDPADTLNRVELQSAVSQFEAVTILEATVKEHVPELHLTHLDHRGQSLVVPLLERLAPGDPTRLYIRAGDVALATSRPSGLSFRNVLEGTLCDIDEDHAGAFATVFIDIDGAVLRAELTRHAISELGLDVGKPVYALLKTASFDKRAEPE